MCGIAGIVSRDRPIRPQILERMCATMRHRGPDSRGVFVDGNAGLAVQRLAVIDREHGDQPISNEDGSVVVVLNGEIYNYKQLRSELLRAGHRFRTASDTEVVVHLYEELGEGCVERLRGMFAFAVWDSRRRKLMLARDRVGKKPLFYSQLDGGLLFASEPRALLASGDVPRDIDFSAIDLFLHYCTVPGDASAFAAIRKVPPAHVLVWRDCRLSSNRYWRLSYRNRTQAHREEEVCERIRELLLDSTRLRLQSDVPVGALLSGGVDSSGVVAAMAQLGVAPLKTFSVGFGVPEFDESSYAREVARSVGADHHEIRLDASALSMLPRLVWHYGEPFADSSALATFAVAELASGQVTVVLNGDGGDESFAGYQRYLRFADAGDDAAEQPYDRYAVRRARSYFDADERRSLYEPGFRDALPERDWRAVLREPYLASGASNVIERLLDADVQTYLPDDLLVKMDTATMAHSVEARSPLLDHEMMELAASLPLSAKLGEGETKRIFKRALRAWLPDRIIDRPKMGFMIPVGSWLRHDFRSLAADVLLDPVTLNRGMFRELRLRELIAEHLDGSGQHEYRLWTLIVFELWLRTYIDRRVDAGPVALPIG